MTNSRLGCFSLSAILASALTLLAIGALVVFNGGELFSPGALNAQAGKVLGGVRTHAEIGGDCAQCHTAPWEISGMADRCNVCHQNIPLQLENPQSFHGALMIGHNLTCMDCHTEHHGPFAALLTMDMKRFPHDSTGYSLASHRRISDKVEFSCSDCHGTGLAIFDQATCRICHLEIDSAFLNTHSENYGQDCRGCHDGIETVHKEYDHSQATFKLEDGHAGLTCEECHREARVMSDFAGRETKCESCHIEDDAHHGQLGKECGTCHTPAGWENAVFDHAQTAYPLVGKHAKAECTQCHPQHIYKGTTTLCFDCHQDGDPHKGQFGQICSVCHTPLDWKPAVYDHSQTAYALTGAHEKVLCEKCHLNQQYKGTRSDCFGCHQKNDPHAAGLGETCETCHTTQAWKPANFDHNTSKFKLSGAHERTDCQKCHATLAYKNTPSTCFGCHQKNDPHNGALGQNCSECHSTQAWKPSHFDHNRSVFKLTGAHVNTGCAKCHTNSAYKGTPTTCYACHQQNDSHKGQFGQGCATCHSTQAWKPSTFNHNTSAFQLTGAHGNTACTKCHVNGVFKGTPSNCYACHQQDDQHGGSLGQDCAGCHSTQAWKPSTFDHNRSAFKLTGAHSNASCGKCHANAVFKGTPANCYACHQQNDPHNGQFGQDCAACHSTQAWKPASFDHNLSAFKLTGAHANVNCTSCHANSVFKGTPQECGACHAEPGYHQGLFTGQSCANCHSTNAWKPAAYNGGHTFPMNHGEKNNTCSSCHQPTLREWTCYACHDQGEILKKHQEKNLGDFSDCLRCHANGKKEDRWWRD